MPAFRAEVSHELGQEQATERLKRFIDLVREDYKDQVSHVEGSWEQHRLNFSLTTFGLTITGEVTVDESTAVVKGQLPFAAVAFKGKIERDIKAELEKALSDA